jgi:CDP-6-deoxy-D-xylo-4-hexulose-3-dehydrase
LGYNLKPLDLQAAIGRAQLKKLPAFIQARKNNWEILRHELDVLGEFFDFMLPTHANVWSKSESVAKLSGSSSAPQPLNPSTFGWDFTDCSTSPSWFGFMLRVKLGTKISSKNVAIHMNQNGIGNRMLFGGNLTKQPVFGKLKTDRPESFRVVGELKGADNLMAQALFLGVYPGFDLSQLQKIIFEIKK